MRKLQSAAAVVAMAGAIGFIGMGTAVASDGGHHGKSDRVNVETEVEQGTMCYLNDSDFNLLGQVGLLNGLLGEGDSGQSQDNAQDCSNEADLG